MVSNGIANHYGYLPCRTEYLVLGGDLVRDLARAVEITPLHNEKKGCYSTSPDHRLVLGADCEAVVGVEPAFESLKVVLLMAAVPPDNNEEEPL